MRVARNMHTVHGAHDVRVRNVDSVRNVHSVSGHDGKNDDKPSPRHRGVSRKPDTQGVHTQILEGAHNRAAENAAADTDGSRHRREVRLLCTKSRTPTS